MLKRSTNSTPLSNSPVLVDACHDGQFWNEITAPPFGFGGGSLLRRAHFGGVGEMHKSLALKRVFVVFATTAFTQFCAQNFRFVTFAIVFQAA